MKISKKKLREVLGALDDAANEIAGQHVRDLDRRPPDDWSPTETLAYDVAHAVKDRLSDKLKILFKA